MSTLGQSLWDSGMEKLSQGYSRQRVLEVNGTKTRLTVSADAYDFQSVYKAEVFDGSKWNVIVHLPGANFSLPSRYAAEVAREAAVEDMFDLLFEAAEAVL